jgi:dihydrofolate synthase/folylpolyglutamate synthase
MGTRDLSENFPNAAPSPAHLLDQLAAPSRLGHRPGLDRIRALLSEMGNPHRALRIIHVGGTSGKGSTATMAAAILQEADYRVGLHVKPHLETVEERFVVDGRSIGASRLSDLIEAYAPIARQIQPSWYELTVALAFEYFRQERVDLAVIEVGLGGTYDATNVVEPASVGLTNVDLDHTEVLGDTVEKIASDKVGIIKPGITAVCGAIQPSVRAIVSARCEAVGAGYWQLGRDVRVSRQSVQPGGSSFDVTTPRRELCAVDLRPLGAHQIANAAVALGVVDAIDGDTLDVSNEAIRRAFATVSVNGRIEIVGHNPLVILDGAHNPAKMASLRAALDDLYANRTVIGVLAFKRGHDLAATIAEIAPRLSRTYLTQFDATTDYGPGQSVALDELAAIWRSQDSAHPAVVTPDPLQAVSEAVAAAGPEDVVCVTGSLYLVGVVRSWLRSRR